MSGTDWRRKALERARPAAEGWRRPAEAARSTDRAPAPGDLFVFDGGDAAGIQWVVVAVEPADRVLVAAADLDREVGAADVAAKVHAAAAPRTVAKLTVRCRFAAWLPAVALDRGRLTGRLAPEDLERVRGKRGALDTGSLRGTYAEHEVETESAYQELEAGLSAALATLVDGIVGAVAVPESVPAIKLSGVDAATGEALLPALALGAITECVRRELRDRLLLEWLRRVHRRLAEPSLGPPFDIDAADVARVGWALLVHADEPAETRSALEPLLTHRRRTGGPVRVLEVRACDDWREWLARHGVAAGETVDPEKVPYYLLIAGSPERIGFDFQQALATQYAVGRLCFDHPSDYRRYADSVVAAETDAAAPAGRRAILFAPRQAGDPLGHSSGDLLDVSVAAELAAADVEPVRLLGAAATRARLVDVLAAGARAPALWLAAAHGLGFQPRHPDQEASQGALVCQDWPAEGAVEPRQVFAARDLADDARIHGSVVVLLASFSAGTPERDELLRPSGGEAPRFAERPFVARLPQRLLAHPGGAALAVVGLVDRAWGAAAAPLRHAVAALLAGRPVGHAVREYPRRHAALASEIYDLRKKMSFGASIRPGRIADVWIERNHVRSLVVLGDPAVRRRAP